MEKQSKRSDSIDSLLYFVELQIMEILVPVRHKKDIENLVGS